MTNRLVAVGDDFTLPAALKVADANLPTRLGTAALNATIESATSGKMERSEAVISFEPAGTVAAAVPGAVAAQVPPLLAAQVPPLVSSALASDGAPAAAAAAAVNTAMAGKAVAEVSQTYGADDGFAIVDVNGAKTSIEVGTDGKPTSRFANDMASVGGFTQGATNYNEGFALADNAGTLIPDAQYGPLGYLADDVLDRLRPRLDRRTVFNTPRMVRRLPLATDAKLVTASLNAVKYMLGTWIPSKFPGTTPITSLGGNGEDQVRHPAAAAFAVAASIYTGVYDPAVTGVALVDAKAAAIRVIKGGALCHVTNTAGGWGAPAGSSAFFWQESSWAQCFAAAAWMLQADTDAQTKTYVNNMLAAEADNCHTATGLNYWTRYDGVEITPGDSKAEEMAWMGGAVAFASVLMPADSRKAAWESKAANYMLYGNARPSDVLATNSTVQGVKMASFDGWNVRQDGLIINHSIIHPDYICAMPELAWSAGVLWAHAGRKIPAAYVHNAEAIYRSLSDVRVGGRTIYQTGTWELFYPQGNDWGTSRMADKAMADVLAHCLGMDSQCTTPAATWADLHLQRCLDMQARYTDGHTYADNTEDSYAGKEPWVARNLALAVLAARLPATTRYNYETGA